LLNLLSRRFSAGAIALSPYLDTQPEFSCAPHHAMASAWQRPGAREQAHLMMNEFLDREADAVNPGGWGRFNLKLESWSVDGAPAFDRHPQQHSLRAIPRLHRVRFLGFVGFDGRGLNLSSAERWNCSRSSVRRVDIGNFESHRRRLRRFSDLRRCLT
jgi:hypothetical protein